MAKKPTSKLVKSSNVKRVGYTPGDKLLTVEFKTGDAYQYRGVPAAVHAKLLKAKSVGGYFAEHVKNRYEVEKV